MKNIIAAAILVVVTAVTSLPGHAQTNGQRITLAQLEQMFTAMRSNPRWNVDGPLLWGYFFTASGPAVLEAASRSLVESGYRFVAIYPGAKKDPSAPDEWWLHVERVEQHSAASLFQRNNELYEFAGKHGLGRYDGMDVGPVR